MVLKVCFHFQNRAVVTKVSRCEQKLTNKGSRGPKKIAKICKLSRLKWHFNNAYHEWKLIQLDFIKYVFGYNFKFYSNLNLKLESAIFYQFFIFSPNDTPSKMFFISSKKFFSLSRYSNFCNFSSSFPHFPDSKGQLKVE